MTRFRVAGRRAEVGVVKVLPTWWPPRIVSLMRFFHTVNQRTVLAKICAASCTYRAANAVSAWPEESHFDRPFEALRISLTLAA